MTEEGCQPVIVDPYRLAIGVLQDESAARPVPDEVQDIAFMRLLVLEEIRQSRPRQVLESRLPVGETGREGLLQKVQLPFDLEGYHVRWAGKEREKANRSIDLHPSATSRDFESANDRRLLRLSKEASSLPVV